MSCIGDAWCPQCEQIIYEGACMCALVCDRHGPVCTTVVPDGIHPRRMHRREPSQLMEYRNGWRVGWTLTMDGPWQRCEPGHPTKSAQEAWIEQWDKDQAQQQVRTTERFRVSVIETRDQLNCNGGGGI